jgi:sterol desaturase/sphingolipid hydroxylase (fatty acid hydroxylase superfamily)
MAKQQTVITPRRPETRTTARRPVGTQRLTRQPEMSKIEWNIPLRKENLFMLVGGIVVIAAAYMLMATAISPDPATNLGTWNNANAVTFAPILAVIGYCIIVPIAIMYRPKGSPENTTDETSD